MSGLAWFRARLGLFKACFGFSCLGFRVGGCLVYDLGLFGAWDYLGMLRFGFRTVWA